MDPIQFACENPVKVTVGVLLSVLFGTLALFSTPVQLTPDVSEPEITVTTFWPGASAQEVEREIVDEQEEQLKSVEGLLEFKSESRDSQGTITLKSGGYISVPMLARRRGLGSVVTLHKQEVSGRSATGARKALTTAKRS